ncbi:MAG TPA: hypothetical protein VK423_01710 [Thermoplasmata archaeon]|nr:hypothetical protein [Thermoplasmata archaeon]
MTGELTGPLVLAIPSAIAFLAAVAWDSWARPAVPPRFQGYSLHQGWRVDPVAVLDEDLRHEKLTGAVAIVRSRLLRELIVHHELSAREVERIGGPFGPRVAPTIRLACRTVRDLEVTYRIAERVEDPRRTDPWSQWRRPRWQVMARSRFEGELRRIETFWSSLEAAS